MRLLVFGPGYSARAAIERLQADAVEVAATARRPEAASDLRDAGIRVIRPDEDELSAAIKSATHVIVSAPPDNDGDPMLRLAASALSDASHLLSIVYLSTVGVYGDHGGDWIDEETPTAPTSSRSIARVEAEESWREVASAGGWPLAILRLSGIYGPGRNALVNLARGTARRLVKPGQVFNRIHVADIGAAVERAMTAEVSGTFNVTDDLPAPPQDVVAYAAELMGVAPPPETPFETADLSPMARSFYNENKRVSNARMKRALGLDLAFPSYREGLNALWKAGEGSSG